MSYTPYLHLLVLTESITKVYLRLHKLLGTLQPCNFHFLTEEGRLLETTFFFYFYFFLIFNQVMILSLFFFLLLSFYFIFCSFVCFSFY